MKILAMIAACGCLGMMADFAFAQAPDYLSHNRAAARAYYNHQPSNGVLVNGRCNGISYGTGARTCGTATGGPVGGINSRN